MSVPHESIDSYYTSKYRNIYTSRELCIPGLRMFGRHTMNQACAPVDLHYHRDAYEFTFVTEGAITFTVDGQDCELTGGDIFMTRPNEVHSSNLHPLSAGEFIWFQLDISDTGRFLFLDEEARANLLNGLSRLSAHTFRLGSRSFESVRKAFELSSDPAMRFRTAACLLPVLYEITQTAAADTRTVSPDIQRVLSHIHENLTAPLSLEELADVCALSVSQFKQKFKSQVGISPRHYINYRKIRLSRKLLLENRSVTEAAMELGFSSSSYFTVVFRRYSACTPSEYIRQKKTGET